MVPVRGRPGDHHRRQQLDVPDPRVVLEQALHEQPVLQHLEQLHVEAQPAGVIRHGPSAHPNALTTMDYPRGNLAFRWFLPDSVPEPPEASLVRLADAPTSIS